MKNRLTQLLCAVLTIVMLPVIALCEGAEYDKALSLLEEGKYPEAKAIFESLGDDEESRRHLSRFHYIPTTMHMTYNGTTSVNEIRLNAQNLPDLITWDGVLDSDTSAYRYDDAGNIIHETLVDEEGVQTDIVYTYDANGRLLKKVETFEEYMITDEYIYNENGLLASIATTTASGYTSSREFTYDEKGRLIKEYAGMEGISKTTEYSYDENGNKVQEIAAFMFSNSTYNAVYTSTYDANGNEIRCVSLNSDGSEDVFDYIYDENNRLIKRHYLYANGTENVFDYTYDENGLVIGREYYGPENERESLTMEYTLVYIPFDLPESAQELLDSISSF